MGRAAADCFAADGARVAVLARSRDDLDATAAALTELGSPDAVGIATDLFDGASVEAAIAEIGERWGHINAARQRRRPDARRPAELRGGTPTTSGSQRVRRPRPERGADHPGRAAATCAGPSGPAS